MGGCVGSLPESSGSCVVYHVWNHPFHHSPGIVKWECCVSVCACVCACGRASSCMWLCMYSLLFKSILGATSHRKSNSMLGVNPVGSRSSVGKVNTCVVTWGLHSMTPQWWCVFFLSAADGGVF